MLLHSLNKIKESLEDNIKRYKRQSKYYEELAGQVCEDGCNSSSYSSIAKDARIETLRNKKALEIVDKALRKIDALDLGDVRV